MTPSLVEHVFVYGTLRRGYAHAMSAWLAEQGQWCGRGRCAGALYRVAAHYPGLVPSDGDWVQGDLYALPATMAVAVLAQLDAYEEIGNGEYRRERCTVYRESGDTVQAWVYVYCRAVSEGCRIDSGDFLLS